MKSIINPDILLDYLVNNKISIKCIMDILNSIPELTEETVIVKKPMTLEQVQQIHTSLTLDNSLTFKVFLSKRPDLSEEDRGIYVKIIERLEKNERIRYQSAMKEMIDANYGDKISH